MIKGVLFDIDGTLVLSNDAHAYSWQKAFAEHGFKVEFTKLRRLIGMGSDKLIAEVEPGLSADAGDGKIIKERRAEIFQQEYLDTLTPAPGSRRLVKTIQEFGFKTIVASSASTSELQSLLKAAEVDDLLKEATTSDDTEHSKPDPDIVQVALDKIGLKADEVVMIGDTPYDVAACQQAGVSCIGLLCGGWDAADLKGTLAVYRDPADLLAHSEDFGY